MSRRTVAPVLLLLAAALSIAAVFAVHRIESMLGPFSEPWATPWISPDGDGIEDVARISFTTRRPELVDVDVVDEDGDVVRHLVDDERIAGPYRTTWDGRDDVGDVVPDGTYRPQITRAGDDRAYSTTRPITVDTLAPIGRLDRATLQEGVLAGLALLESGAKVEVVGADGQPLPTRSFRTRSPDAASARPIGPHPEGTRPVRFSSRVGDAPLESLDVLAVDRAGNRRDLLADDGRDRVTVAP